jgi:hypothetical protein
VAEWAIDHKTLVWALVGTTLMTYIGYLSRWLSPYAPISWVAVGLLGGIMLAFLAWIGAHIHARVVRTRTERLWIETASVNPLDGVFRKQRIRVSDFFHPYYKATQAAKFEDCDLLGPATVFVAGGTFLNTNFNRCQAVIVLPNVKAIGVVAFENCTFERCSFYEVTFLLPKPLYEQFRKDIKGDPIPAISDGTAGNFP